MVGATVRSLLVYYRRVHCLYRVDKRLSPSPIALRARWISLHCNRRETKTSVPSVPLLKGHFGLDGLASLSSLRTTNIGLFFGTGRPPRVSLGLALLLNFDDLQTDSFMRRASSIILKEEMDRISKSILSCSIVL